jgi:hypothetical protein
MRSWPSGRGEAHAQYQARRSLVTGWDIRIEPDGETTLDACDDCGHPTRSVWGYVSSARAARAAYFIRWTDGHLERGALLVISIGAWGQDAHAPDRVCVALQCRMGVDRPQFMVVDAAPVPWARGEFLGVKLSRESALAHAAIQEVFAISDRIVADDQRFRSFLLSGGEKPLA